jgi:hypothetical protein
MKTKLIIAALAVLFSLTLVAQQQSKVPGPGEPESRILAKLSEIVQIRKQLVEYYQSLYDAGEASTENVAGLRRATVELAEAQINLAREGKQRDALITALQSLVAAHEQRVEMAKRNLHVNSTNAAKAEVGRAQVALLEAQVRLIRGQ